MIISLLVAMDEHGGIGKAGQLPWRLPDDMRRFKALTSGHHIIMGRKTYESIGRPLPGRTAIVLTRSPGYQSPACQSEACWIVHSLPAALALAESRRETEAFVIGGSAIFTAALPLAQRIYLTRVHAVVPADVFFPPFDPAGWLLTESQTHEKDANHPFSFTFSLLVKPASDSESQARSGR